MHMKTIIGGKWSAANTIVCQSVAPAAVTKLPNRTGALQ